MSLHSSVGHICVTTRGHKGKQNTCFPHVPATGAHRASGPFSLGGKARYVPNKDSLIPQTRSEYCLLTWVELLVGIMTIVPVSCGINLETLTSPEIQNSRLREMVWTAIKAPVIYTLTHAKLLLTSF